MSTAAMSTVREIPKFALSDTTLGWEPLSGMLVLGLFCAYGFNVFLTNFFTWLSDFEHATQTVYPLNWILTLILAFLLVCTIMTFGLGIMLMVAALVLKITESRPTTAAAKMELTEYVNRNYSAWTVTRKVEWVERTYMPGTETEPEEELDPSTVYRAKFFAPIKSISGFSGFVNNEFAKYAAFRITNFSVEESTAMGQNIVTITFLYSMNGKEVLKLK